jgi:hypothetical protein
MLPQASEPRNASKNVIQKVKGRDKLSTSADRRVILEYVIKIKRGRAWSGLI